MTIKQGDTFPYCTGTFTDAAGNPVDVTSATVTFSMTSLSGVPMVVSGPVTKVTPASGIVEYHWQAADVVAPGSFAAQFKAVFPDMTISTFPNMGYFYVTILPAV